MNVINYRAINRRRSINRRFDYDCSITKFVNYNSECILKCQPHYLLIMPDIEVAFTTF